MTQPIEKTFLTDLKAITLTSTPPEAKGLPALQNRAQGTSL